MKTLEDIKTIVNIQNLSSLYKCDTALMYQEFCKYTTESGIDQQIGPLLAVDSTKNFPVNYIIYNQDTDQLSLNCDLFSKQNSTINWVKYVGELAVWKLQFNNTYMLEYNVNSKASVVFSSKLPSISKIL